MIDLHHGDCFQIADDVIQDGTAALAFVDPPYNIGIFKKMEPGAYLEWCEQWIALCDRKLKPNGAFWVSHSKPRVLADISRIIEQYGRGMVNWITWDKWNFEKWKVEHGIKGHPLYGAMWKQICSEPRQSFGQAAEYLIYHADEGEWTAQCDKERGFIFEPLRAYLDGEWKRAGMSKIDANVACGFSATPGGMAARHYFSRSQWCLPTESHYHALRQYANAHNHGGEYLRREYEDLRREYEDLRREYEDLRYTFNNPGKVSSVWQFPPAERNGHPTPKPPGLLRRIVETTSNPGDLVFDPMCGSGQMPLVCIETGRDCVAIEIEREWYELAQSRIAAALSTPEQLTML